MPDLRIGVVDYANVAPLIEGLPGDQVHRAVPSRLVDMMAGDELDVGLLPVMALGSVPGLVPVNRLGIAADGRCDSVLLFAARPLAAVRAVALDASSRTAAALTRVLLDRAGARDVKLVERRNGTVAERLAGVDAALLIGDPALRAEAPQGVTRLDLSAEWKRATDLPFVFACWMGREDRPLTKGERALVANAAERGLQRIGVLAERESRRTGLPGALLDEYLRRLQYRLDDRHFEAMRSFLDEAHRLGIAPLSASFAVPSAP